MTAQTLIDQENVIRDLWEAGEISSLLHLMGGNEEQLVEIFKEIDRDDFVLCSHRCHFHYTLHGGTDLVEKVLAGKSMFLYMPRFLCSAIVGGVCSIAVGIALSYHSRGSKQRVWAFLGDGATDQGAFWEAIRFAEGRDLPITFVVEDNGGQCGVSMEQRWGPEISSSMLLDIAFRHPKVRYYRYTPKYPHAGNAHPDGTPTRPKLKWQIERSFPKPV